MSENTLRLSRFFLFLFSQVVGPNFSNRMKLGVVRKPSTDVSSNRSIDQNQADPRVAIPVTFTTKPKVVTIIPLMAPEIALVVKIGIRLAALISIWVKGSPVTAKVVNLS